MDLVGFRCHKCGARFESFTKGLYGFYSRMGNGACPSDLHPWEHIEVIFKEDE